ncbi:MAG: hypothetical protein CM1200mP30_02620 [Pseudomonadota bacterium]|nr:MAG: hypothetical protein CM1200mP30_02620 [Pseudomonadota bacterium]
MQGAARHVTSAFEIALADAKAKSSGIPVHQLFGKVQVEEKRMYGVVDAVIKKTIFFRELEMLEGLGINLYKIRAVKEDFEKLRGYLKKPDEEALKLVLICVRTLRAPLKM